MKPEALHRGRTPRAGSPTSGMVLRTPGGGWRPSPRSARGALQVKEAGEQEEAFDEEHQEDDRRHGGIPTDEGARCDRLGHDGHSAFWGRGGSSRHGSLTRGRDEEHLRREVGGR